ncbi:UDP-N-acetylglucosamine transporter TMEM241 isoform X6 [Pelodiscus sinensis]|uniref:UDP-N-acetylglucosamine transporter TMEM241 isoform X6 n=1 Tax=Pelodiscus sinensis TaxID=13735 RepID=UPI003F6B7413
MYLKRPVAGLSFCLFYLASYFTNKYVLSVLKFTYPTLFQGSEVLTWLPASVFFVGIIYAGSRALSRLHTSLLKICSVLFLLIAAGCLPLFDTEFDPDGYLWALIHFICVGVYKVIHKLWKTNSLSDLDQQYINYVFRMGINIVAAFTCFVVLLASASHPAGDLFSALDFPFLYFYRFHSSCCASGLLGFFLMLHTVKLKSITSSWQYAAWSFLAKVTTAGLSPFIFGMTANIPMICCLLLGGLGEALLVYTERMDT